MSELKPCPFCGGEAHVRELRTCDFILYSMSCETPRCYGFESQVWFSTPDAAAEAWNRRAGRTCGEWRGDPRPDAIGHAAEHEDDELWCERCDIELDEEWAYCPHCGAKVVVE